MAGHAVHMETQSNGIEEGTKSGIEAMPRMGYATKGVVYMLVGGLAALAAWGAGGKTTDSEGAISEIGSKPYGQVLLWIVAVGLGCYCVWRLIEAVTDPDHQGTDVKGIAIRLRRAGSGIIYGLLAFKVVPLSFSSGGSDSGESKKHFAAYVMSWPGGKWVIAAIGLAVLAYGLYQIYRGLAEKFKKKYDASEMNETQRKVALYSGKIGIPARGITFGIIGFFVIIAAWKLDPNQVKGTGEALDVLARQPYGLWVLLVVSLGLMCYGVFCLVQARYRSFHVDSTL